MDKPLADVSAEMAVDKDAPIAVRDGAILRANIFRPGRPGKYPVIMSMGIYGKDVHFAEFVFAPLHRAETGFAVGHIKRLNRGASPLLFDL